MKDVPVNSMASYDDCFLEAIQRTLVSEVGILGLLCQNRQHN